MRDEQGSAGQGSRVTRGLVVAACVVPIFHFGACARLGYEESHYSPVLEPSDPGPRFDFGDLGRLFEMLRCWLGVFGALLAIVMLLTVLLHGDRWRTAAGVLYGPLLLFIGLGGLRQPDLHRWIWGSISLLAGAILCAFGASHLLLYWSASRPRVQNVAVFGACTLALLFASLNLPAQTANRVLTTSTLSWTYHRAESRRDPYELISGWKCTTHGSRCDCIQTDQQADRGTCDEQRCCYEWDTWEFVWEGPSRPVHYGCFCVSVEPSSQYCPSPSSFRNDYGVPNYRRQTCP